MGTMWVSNIYSNKEPVAQHLHDFIRIFIKPFYDNSIILEQRKAIREDRHLNQLLFDNLNGLHEIFILSKEPEERPKSKGQQMLQAFSKNLLLGKLALGAPKKKSDHKFTLECAYALFDI